jgi:hypothetical protein
MIALTGCAEDTVTTGRIDMTPLSDDELKIAEEATEDLQPTEEDSDTVAGGAAGPSAVCAITHHTFLTIPTETR